MKTKEYIVIYTDGNQIKAEKVMSESVNNAAVKVLGLGKNVLIFDVVMVVENTGNGAFCMETVRGLLDCGTISIDAIGRNTPQDSGWIDVKDDSQKPKEGQSILIWNKDDTETAIFLDGKITNFVCELPKVTHWMPKPKAPQSFLDR